MTGRFSLLLVALLAGFATVTSPACAEMLSRKAKTPSNATEATVAAVQHAIDEQRYLDAGQMLDEAMLSGARQPQLVLLGGQLNLARGRFADALTDFRGVQGVADVKGQALEGEGLALASLGRSDEAILTLRAAISESPGAWRAWNALGAEYDRQGDWSGAEAAYSRALTASGDAAIVLNNRGYSRILQKRVDEAIVDLAAALQKRPGFEAARTNLRLALALKGDYDRALAGSSAEDRASLLNNAGFAAGLRGDYARAEEMLGSAMGLRGEYYDRAAANLKFISSLRPAGAGATEHVAAP